MHDMVRDGLMVYCVGPPLAVTRASRASSYFYWLEGKLRRLRFQEKDLGELTCRCQDGGHAPDLGLILHSHMLLVFLDFFYWLERIVF